MASSGIEAAVSGVSQAVLISEQLKNLVELQGELIVELINSSKVPGPSDISTAPGMGVRLDIHA